MLQDAYQAIANELNPFLPLSFVVAELTITVDVGYSDISLVCFMPDDRKEMPILDGITASNIDDAIDSLKAAWPKGGVFRLKPDGMFKFDAIY